MSELFAFDTDALALACQGAATVGAGARLSCAPFLAPYRRLPLPGHPGAGESVLDLGFISAAMSFGGPALLEATHLVIGEPRMRAAPSVVSIEGGVEMGGARRSESAADAFALALGLSLESAKIRAALGLDVTAPDYASLTLSARALQLSAEDLLAAIGPSPDDVRQNLIALATGGDDRVVHGPAPQPRVDVAALDAHTQARGRDAGPIFVVAGAFDRLHDVLSPFVRQLQPELASLLESRAPDAIYRAAQAVFEIDTEVAVERIDEEQRDGFRACGDALALKCEHLNVRRVDSRARASATALQRSRATIVFVPDAAVLTEVLDEIGPRVRAVVALSVGMLAPGAMVRPEVLIDAATGAANDLDNALIAKAEKSPDAKFAGEGAAFELPHVAVSVPSLGFAPLQTSERIVIESGLAPLVYAAARARAQGLLAPRVRVAHAVMAPDDDEGPTQTALRVLERMAPVGPGAR